MKEYKVFYMKDNEDLANILHTYATIGYSLKNILTGEWNISDEVDGIIIEEYKAILLIIFEKEVDANG